MAKKSSTNSPSTSATGEVIPAAVLAGFGLSGEPVALDGGEGTSVLVGGVVCKPILDPAVAEWGQLAATHASSPDFVFPEPVRARDGSFVVDGWVASQFVPALTSLHDAPAAVVRLADAVTATLSAVAQPLPHRTDRWARGIDAAYGAPLPTLPTDATALVHRLLDPAGPAPDRDLIVHADLTGNTFVDPVGRPVVLDLSPARASAGFAAAVVIADHLLWHDGDATLATLVEPADLRRALAFRLIAEQLADDPRHGARLDDYRTVLARITP